MSEPPVTSKNTWTGATNRDWTDGSNWSTGAVPTADTSAAVEGSANPPVLGEASQATGAVKALVIGGGADDGGGLTLQNNSALTVETTALEACVVGRGGTGTLTVSATASLHVAGAIIVGQNVGKGTALVEGGGSVTAGKYIYIGLGGPDTGGNPDLLGAVTVTTGGRVTAGERLVVGQGAPASLSISNATVSAPFVETAEEAAITLEVLAGGVLETRELTKGCDKSQVAFDGGTIRATGDSRHGMALIGSTAGPVTIRAGGLTVDDGGHTVAVSAVLDGPGVLTKVGSGTVALHPDNKYVGGTRVNEGTLRVGRRSTGDVTVETGAAVVFSYENYDDEIYHFDSVISGGGRVEHTGEDLHFLRDNTYTGGTTISSGRLYLGNNTTEGGIVGDVVVAAGAGLIVWRSDTYVCAGRVTGEGALRQTGSGTTVLTGACTHTGGTSVGAGTLQLGDGGAAGHLAGDVDVSGGTEWVSPATFVFKRSDTYTFDGIISGGGGVTQAGSGTVILTAANACTGPTTIDAGTLQVAGSIASPVRVNDRGTLAGSGSIGGEVTSSGVVSPGANGAGTLTIAGNFTSNGGTLAISASLGGDESPHTLLSIAGDAVTGSGPTGITIANAGGTGAATVGDGIKIVEVGGTSPSGLFVLASPVVVGAYRYDLAQGSVTNPEDRNWYLRTVDVGV